MRTLFTCALLAGGVFLASGIASATTLLQLSLPQMTKDSTMIVRGTVAQVSVQPRGTDIYTHYKIQVSETWKGTPASTVDVAIPGGIYNKVRETVPGAPSLSSGQDYVLFLWTSKSGLTTITGLSQGLFPIVRAANGQLTISRPVASSVTVDATGHTVAGTPVEMSVIELRAAVAAAVTGGGN